MNINTNNKKICKKIDCESVKKKTNQNILHEYREKYQLGHAESRRHIQTLQT